MKPKALAAFARDYGARFHGIETISEVNNNLKVLDMQLLPSVRDAVLAGKQSAIGIYKSSLAVAHDPAVSGEGRSVRRAGAHRADGIR